jgi:hypothetical protein
MPKATAAGGVSPTEDDEDDQPLLMICSGKLQGRDKSFCGIL